MGYIVLKEDSKLVFGFIGDDKLYELNTAIINEIKKREATRPYTEEIEYADEDQDAAPNTTDGSDLEEGEE
ncbi:MAG: hypothetical protein ACOCZ5_03080 [bacterium]